MEAVFGSKLPVRYCLRKVPVYWQQYQHYPRIQRHRHIRAAHRKLVEEANTSRERAPSTLLSVLYLQFCNVWRHYGAADERAEEGIRTLGFAAREVGATTTNRSCALWLYCSANPTSSFVLLARATPQRGDGEGGGCKECTVYQSARGSGYFDGCLQQDDIR